jgi:hypothetical protein
MSADLIATSGGLDASATCASRLPSILSHDNLQPSLLQMTHTLLRDLESSSLDRSREPLIQSHSSTHIISSMMANVYVLPQDTSATELTRTTSSATIAKFGAQSLRNGMVQGALVVVGTGCSSLQSIPHIEGAIAVAERGECEFIQKVSDCHSLALSLALSLSVIVLVSDCFGVGRQTLHNSPKPSL